MIEEIHECAVCRGRFSSATLLASHVCPLRDGNEYIELTQSFREMDADEGRYTEVAPEAGTVETKLGNEYGSGDAAIAIGQDAFMAGFDACLEHIKSVPLDLLVSDLKENPGTQIAKQIAWARYEPPEDIKALI